MVQCGFNPDILPACTVGSVVACQLHSLLVISNHWVWHCVHVASQLCCQPDLEIRNGHSGYDSYLRVAWQQCLALLLIMSQLLSHTHVFYFISAIFALPMHSVKRTRCQPNTSATYGHTCAHQTVCRYYSMPYSAMTQFGTWRWWCYHTVCPAESVALS
jgi:hypothetical protein